MARSGFQSRGDALINQLNDGVSLDDMWVEITEATDLWNETRSAIASLLTFRTTAAADAVPQSIGGEHFEEATEYGIPRGIGRPDYMKLGYGWRDFDIASRFTWKALRSMSSDQVTHAVQRVYEADSTLVNGTIMNALFNNVSRFNDYGHQVYPLFNGDGMVPLPYAGQSFDGTHQHYLTTASTVLDADDIERLAKHVKSHGYGTTPGSRLILLANPLDVETAGLSAWRAGVEYRSGAPLPKFDFIVSSNAPAYLSAESVRGATPPAEVNGLPTLGSYGGVVVIESYYVPAGYAALVASGGPNSDLNPIGFREHTNDAYNGLRIIPGSRPGYPLLETYWARGFGVGVRHRGAAACVQITTNPTYTPPTITI